jgi:pilus assembly protein Flp/PilA
MRIHNWFNRMVARAVGATQREEGQTMVEYGLIITLVALAVVVAITALGTQLGAVFNKIYKDLGGA